MELLLLLLSMFLLGATNHSQVANPKNSTRQLEELALEFRDIPHANRTAWNNAVANDPRVLIRLSTSKLVAIADIRSTSSLRCPNAKSNVIKPKKLKLSATFDKPGTIFVHGIAKL